MKTQNMILAMAFSLFSVLASAQNSDIERSTSKDVQKFSNKRWVVKEHLLTVASVGYPLWTLSKDVQLSSNHLSKKVAPGNMISTGYPVWTISKGVHKFSYPAKVTPVRPLMNDVIVRL